MTEKFPNPLNKKTHTPNTSNIGRITDPLEIEKFWTDISRPEEVEQAEFEKLEKDQSFIDWYNKREELNSPKESKIDNLPNSWQRLLSFAAAAGVTLTSLTPPSSGIPITVDIKINGQTVYTNRDNINRDSINNQERKIGPYYNPNRPGTLQSPEEWEQRNQSSFPDYNRPNRNRRINTNDGSLPTNPDLR